ncbi:MAG: flavodoxin [Clostridia bacterium]|nr:flavodoxin [Clostridia bacterium]
MKRIISAISIIVLVAALLASCGQTAAPDDTSNVKETTASSKEPVSVTAETASQPERQKDVLVVVFSATGTTKAVAERIAAYADADLYEIKAAQEYTAADLNWNDRSSRTTIEQNDKSARPQIGSPELSLDGYKTVFIGYPIWWGEEPRILDTFVEKYAFDGVTCVPFCTSGGSGVGRSDKNLADHAGTGNWVSGKLLNHTSDADLQNWIDSVM